MPSNRENNYYRILQVDASAEPEVIEAAFKRLARKYHPDKDRSAGATAKMQELNAAYETLSDSAKRSDYDRRLRQQRSSAENREAEADQRQSRARTREERWAEKARTGAHSTEAQPKQSDTRSENPVDPTGSSATASREFPKSTLRLIAALIVVIVIISGIWLYTRREPSGATPNTSGNLATSNAGPLSSAQNHTRTVSVPATVMWYDTGIDVPAKSTVTIQYISGQWSNATSSNLVDGAGKQWDHRDLLIVPSSYLAALVGKVAKNSFHVGNSYSGKPGQGRLYLSINDVTNTFNDNQGFLNVRVEID